MNLNANALASLADSMQAGHTIDKQATREILERIHSVMGEAIDVWNAGLKDDANNSVAYTPVVWLGPERSRQLFAAHRTLRDYAQQLTHVTQTTFNDSMGIVEQVDIVLPYTMLAEGETGAARAQSAVESIQDRQLQVENFLKKHL